MRKALTLVLVSILAASLLLVITPQSYGQDVVMTEDLRINSYSYYTSPNTGAFIVIGEVQNIGTRYFHSAIIGAAVFNSSGEFLAEPVVSFVYADQLAPGETAGFYMVFTAAKSITGDLSWVNSGFGNIEFYRYGGSDDTPRDTGLHIVVDNGATTGNGNYSVSGVVLNRGTKYPEKSFVAGTFYDSQGKVIAVGLSNYMTRYLVPNNVSEFTVGLYDAPANIGNQIASYSLRVVTEGTLNETPPSPTITPTTSPGSTPNPTSTSSAAPINNDNNAASSNTLYIALAAIGIAVAVVVLVLLLKRR